MAIEAHGNQKYGDEPYDYHLANVATGARNIVKTMAGSIDTPEFILQVRATGWLHDVLEDTEKTAKDLLDAGVPSTVVEAVVLLTRKEDISHARYLMEIVEAEGDAGIIAWIVKVADTSSNLQHSTQELNKKRVKKYTAQLQYLMDNSKWI
ncbi:MAG: hypothetical protein KUG81_01885 [Gammaproteobacteria bacterium]|nr:hypothetical protein [Gammaproteobacteria bacterium]